ncbi:MAG: tail fiber domain-containing protein [Bacteroidota bacterium]
MKIRNIFMYGMAFFCLFLISTQTIGQDVVKDVDITSDQASVQMVDAKPTSYFVEIGGPNNYYQKQRVESTNAISLSNLQKDGEKFKDGLYTLQITPIIELTQQQRTDLLEMRNKNDQEAIAAYRDAHDLPTRVDQFSMNFRIQNGKFVNPDQTEGNLNLPSKSSQWELDHPSLYASLNPIHQTAVNTNDLATDNTNLTNVDQVFNDDVIITFSLCIGNDCVNGESFGFDTVRLKENNLRIKFLDTSTTASFPQNDWEITINDSSNGGANYFAITDVTGGRVPFRVDAGAPTNALRVESTGDIGIGIDNPVVEVHVVDGDSPTLRLEQNGSSGFAAQTFDIASNEANFFVRDVTNGSQLPFKIKPGADNNALFVAANNNIGLRTDSPSLPLHVRRTNAAELDLIRIENTGVTKTVDIGVNAMDMPFGTTAERPTAALATDLEGKLRYNTDNDEPEFHDGNDWLSLIAAGSTFDVTNTGAPALFRVNRTDGKIGGLLTGLTNAGFYFDDTGDFGIEPTTRAILESGTSFPGATTFVVKGATGRVGINCSNPSSELHVSGTISTTAAMVDVSIACSSDKRFKKNISPLQNSLEKVLNIQGVNYDWRVDEFPQKNFNEDQQIGFIAQELEEILPLVVMTDKEGYKSVDYSRLTPVLVEAVKEQQQIIDAQQTEINELKSQVASLEDLKAQVAALTQMVMKQNESAKANTQVGDE